MTPLVYLIALLPAMLTATERTQRARIAALTRWSKENPKANAERASAGLREKFRRAIDAEFPGLDETEAARRAECRYRAHMVRVRFARTKKARAAS